MQVVRHCLMLPAILALTSTAPAADWPTYRGDTARSGSAIERFSFPLSVQWQQEAPAAPQLAWSSGEGRVIEGKLLGHRVKFDDAFHPAIVGGKVYFGSSVDHQLRCVDLETGRTLWTFFTGGPIRLAPTVQAGKVYFGSDDGHVYCLEADTGEKVWSLRASPKDDWLLARGELVSRWPVRTGVLLYDDIAYFGAGIFPHENIYIYAVNAADGSVVWREDNVSDRDAGRNDLSPQGYLLANDDYLFIPSGRSLPATFDRRTGQLLHKRTYSWRSTAGGVVGGTKALLADEQLYCSGPHHFLAIEQNDGDPGFGWFAGREMVFRDDQAYVATGSMVARLDREAYAVNSRRRHKLELDIAALTNQVRGERDRTKAAKLQEQIDAAMDEMRQIANVGITWQQKSEDDSALLISGNHLFTGGEGHVTAYAADTGEEVWNTEVEGEVRGLAAADGHLLVSTDTGQIYAFAHNSSEPRASAGRSLHDGRGTELAHDASPYTADDLTARYEQAAEDILQQTGNRRGFALVVEGQWGRLAYELARRSDLKIYVVEPDADKVQRAREALSAAGLYGHRVTVHHADADAIPYSNYFANLIVSDALAATGQSVVDPARLVRHLKPNGGVLVTRPATDASVRSDVAHRAGIEESEVTLSAAGDLTLITRGPLPGAGNWSHQYGNPANTAVSPDTRVKGGLGVLWYGDPGIGDMVNRHEGAVGPLATGGRLFVQGETTIKAYDAYNGLHLWTYDNPDALRTGVFQNQNPGNLAASDDRLFHYIHGECFELDAATGEVLRVHRLPSPRDNGDYEWGYVAVQNGMLYGTATMRKELESSLRRRGRQTDDATDGIFAINLASGEHAWHYQGQSISHHTIAIGPEQVYFIDSSITSAQRQELLQQDKSHLVSLTGRDKEIAEERLKNADVRRAVALDARTGEQLWAEPVDVTDCSEIGIGGGELTLMYQDGVLLLGGANANGHYWQQFINGEFARRRLVALSAEDGYKLWAKDANYRHRPIVIGQKVLAEPWMFDLKTGEQLMRPHPLTGKDEPWSMMRTGHHCGMLTGCDSGMLMFRSGDTGFMDLEQDAGVRHFSGHRLGCWINAIPANGLVMIPEASAGCVCLFSIAATIVLEPRDEQVEWGIFSAVGAQTPVKQMAINLGAPGDRKDDEGRLWLSYPRYTAYKPTSLDVALEFSEEFAGGGGFRNVSELSTQITGTQTPWLYTSWAQGLTKLTLPLLGKDDPPATYTVRLHFADPRHEEHGPSRCDILFNGQPVVEDMQIAARPGEPVAAVVKQIDNVRVTDRLTIELRPTQGVPLLCAVEVQRDE